MMVKATTSCILLVASVFAFVGTAVESRRAGYQSSSLGPSFADRNIHDRKILLHHAVLDTTQITPVDVSRFTALNNDDEEKLYMVQMKSPILGEDRRALEGAIGQTLHRYLPHNTFLVYAGADAILGASQLECVVWIGEFHPHLKLGPKLTQSSFAFRGLDATSSGTVHHPELIVSLFPLSGVGVNTVHRSVDAAQELANAWIPEAEAGISASFSVEADQGDRVLVSGISIRGHEVTLRSELQEVAEWLALPSYVDEVDVAPTIGFANMHAKALTQADSGRAESNMLPFERHNMHGEGQVLGIGDSGIDSRSCFFADDTTAVTFTNITHGTLASEMTASSHRKVIQYIVSRVGDQLDLAGHGTHVAGTLAGEYMHPNQGSGSDFNGMAPEAAIAFFDIQNGDRVSIPMNLDTDFFPYMEAVGAHVHCNSWGETDAATLSGYTRGSQDVDSFVANHPNALIVFAAGNLGDQGGHTVTPPGTAKNVLTIGAVLNAQESFEGAFCQGGSHPNEEVCTASRTWDENGFEDALARFSSIGPTTDGRIKPDLVAPGMEILSANDVPCSGGADDLEAQHGTSMAAPVIAGSMALVRQYFMEGFYPSGSRNPDHAFEPSAALLKAIAINGAFGINQRRTVEDDWLKSYDMPSPPNEYEGFGRLRLNRGLVFSDQDDVHHSMYVYAFEDHVLHNLGDEHDFTFCSSHVYSRHPPRFTLVWTDPPAAAHASAALVINDLDLAVETEHDTTWHYPNGQSGPDQTNNVERVVMPSDTPPNIQYKVRVSATRALPMGPQTFALVASGRIVDKLCTEEFPNGAVPDDRYDDLSLTEAGADTAEESLFDTSDPLTNIIAAIAGAIVMGMLCCLFCACKFDDSFCCCRRRVSQYHDNDDEEQGGAQGHQAANQQHVRVPSSPTGFGADLTDIQSAKAGLRNFSSSSSPYNGPMMSSPSARQ